MLGCNKKIKQFSAYLYKRSKSNTTLLFFVLGFLVFNLFLLPFVLTHYGLQGRILLDLRFGFTPDQAHKAFLFYGDYGRRGIIIFTGIVDSLYPFVYASLLALSISRLQIRLAINCTKWQLLNVLPFVAALFDLMENSGILLMLQDFPNLCSPLVWATSLVSILKWTLLAGCLFIIGFLITKLLHNKWMRA